MAVNGFGVYDLSSTLQLRTSYKLQVSSEMAGSCVFSYSSFNAQIKYLLFIHFQSVCLCIQFDVNPRLSLMFHNLDKHDSQIPMSYTGSCGLIGKKQPRDPCRGIFPKLQPGIYSTNANSGRKYACFKYVNMMKAPHSL